MIVFDNQLQGSSLYSHLELIVPSTPPPMSLGEAANTVNAAIWAKSQIPHLIRRRNLMAMTRPTRPRLGRHDLHLEGCLKLSSSTGTVLEVPVTAILPGALSPAFHPSALGQFQTVLDQLLVNPITIAFSAYLENRESQTGLPHESSLSRFDQFKNPNLKYNIA